MKFLWKTVFEAATPVSAGQEISYTDHLGASFTIRGPGEVYIRAREFGERRVATVQRRARGVGDIHALQTRAPSRRLDAFLRDKYGRRAGDEETHRDRRVHGSLSPMQFRRRKGDERRRTNHYSYSNYHDPRIRALERRRAP